MNWEAIGTIAEVVGAVGVIVSLLYLAVQIRRANINYVADSHHRVTDTWGNHTSIVMSDDNVAAFVKGLNAYEELSPEERVKFDFCISMLINLVETTIYHADAGVLDEVLEMEHNYLGPRLFAYPGFEQWWKHGDKSGFSPETQEWVDKEIELNRGSATFWEHGN